MIEHAVASTLMRLPVAELSGLRQMFLASSGGLSLEGFVAAMLPPPLPPAGTLVEANAINSRRKSRIGMDQLACESCVTPMTRMWIKRHNTRLCHICMEP